MLKIKMIAIVFFGAAISLFSKDLSTSNNQPTQAKVVIEYEDGKTILSAPDLEPKEQCTYQWQQSADGKTWKNIRGAKKPQAQAVKDLPVNTFVRLQIKDGKSILYSTGAQTKPIDIASPLGYVYKSCTVKLEAVFIDDVDEKFIKTDDNNAVAYQWYKKDESGVWKPILSNDGNGEGLVLATTEEGWYKFLSFSDGGYSDNYETEKEEGVDYISSVEYYLEQKGGDGGLGELHFNKQATSITVNQIEYEIGNKDADPIEISVCAGDQVEMNVDIVYFSENVTYKWEKQRANSNKWVDAGAQKKLSHTMNQGTMEFRCTVTPSVDLGCEREAVINFTVKVYDEPSNPQLKVEESTTNDGGVKKIGDIYYVCADPCQGTDCGNNEVKLIVNNVNTLGGCTFKGVQDPANPVSEGQIPQPTYIYEMAVYKWEGTDWGTEPDEKYTKLLNNYDPGQGLSYDSETKGFHFNKRTFKYEFDKSDETKIQEESIKVCIHVIDSCAWIANKNGANEPLYKIGVATEPVIIAKYPTLKEQLEEIKKDITFKYKKGENGAENPLPIGDECKKIDGEKVFVEWGEDAKTALKEALKKITYNEKIKFEWELSDYLKEKIDNGNALRVIDFTASDYDANNDNAFNTLLESTDKEISFTFKDKADVGCDLQDRTYGRNATPIKLKITTELCKEEVEKVDTVRKVNQVQLRGLIDCNAVEGEKKVCPNNETYQLSFDAKYGARAIDNPETATANYRIWVWHKNYATEADEATTIGSWLQLDNSGSKPCDGTTAWWNGDQTNFVYELNIKNNPGINKFKALVVTERCNTIIGTSTADNPEHYKATIDEQIQELNDNADPCGFSWDTTEFVIKVSNSPTAPLIAILDKDYTADINQTDDKIEIKKGTTVVGGFDEYVKNIERYGVEKQDGTTTDGLNKELAPLKDDDDEIAWTIYALEKGQNMPKVSLLTLEGGDSLGCNCNEHTIDLTENKQVKQSTYTYSWEKSANGTTGFTEVEQRHYASWQNYKEKNVPTSQRFTGIFEVPALGDKEEEVFYRLKMTDCCGNVTYSNIIQITAAESDPVTPVIGWDITEDETEKDKRGANYPYTDKENKKTTYYYNIETKTCANGAVDPIAVVNTKEFEENESPIDKFYYKWQTRNVERTWSADGKEVEINWNNVAWTNIANAEGQGESYQTYTPTNYQENYAYQYRLVAWAPSHLKPDAVTPRLDTDDPTIYQGSIASKPVTVIVYKDVTKTSPNPNGEIEILGTKNAPITDPLKLNGTTDDEYAMVLDNPDELPYTYSWEVFDGNDYVLLNASNAATYFVTSTSYIGSTLQVSKYPSDANPLYYKGIVTYECGTHEQVFIVQANSSEKTEPVIGYEICEQSNNDCDNAGKKERKFTEVDGNTEKTTIVYYKDNNIYICATTTATDLDKTIGLVNGAEFTYNQLTTDVFKYKWQKRIDTRTDGKDPDWKNESGDIIQWEDITDANGNVQGGQDYTPTETFEAGKAYQYRLVAWAESHLEKDGENNPIADPADQAINKGMEVSNIITVLVWNDITRDDTKMQDEADKDENMTFDSNGGKTTLEGTIHEALDQGKALTIIIDNPDKIKHPETYTWYVGKSATGYESIADDEWANLTNADETTDPKLSELLKEYNIAAKPDGATLTITQMPDDATPLYYKVVAEACTTIEHIFEVKAVYSKETTPIIGYNVKTYEDGVDDYNNWQDRRKQGDDFILFDKRDVFLCAATDLTNTKYKLATVNTFDFAYYQVDGDEFQYQWEKNEAERPADGGEIPWSEDDWQPIANENSQEYTPDGLSFEAGKAYQYRLRVHRKKQEDETTGDLKEGEKYTYSDPITFVVYQKFTKIPAETIPETISVSGCVGDETPRDLPDLDLTYTNIDKDKLNIEYTWYVGKDEDENGEVDNWTQLADATTQADLLAEYLIGSTEFDKSTLTIIKLPDDDQKLLYYKGVVSTTICNYDAIEKIYKLQANKALQVPAYDFRFFINDNTPLSQSATICAGGAVTMRLEATIQDGNADGKITCTYMFSTTDPTTPADPTDPESEELDVHEKDYATSIQDEVTLYPPDNGFIWVEISDECGTKISSVARPVTVNPLPTIDITCADCDEIICLNKPLELSYTPTTTEPINYAWKVESEQAEFEILGPNDQVVALAQTNSLSTIKVKWTKNNAPASQEFVEATITLTATNTSSGCPATDQRTVKICHEELLPQVTIGQKMNTEILLITEGIPGEQLYKWGYTSKTDSKKTDTTDWVPYSYWRYDYPYTDYGWKEPHTIDNTKYSYWVIIKGASDEKSYCQQTSELRGTTDVNPEEKKHRYYTVRTKTDVTSAQNIPVYIDNPELKSVHLRLISSFGVVVVQKQLPPQATIETSLPATFSSGLYLLHVQVGDEQTTVKIRIQ